MENLTVLLDLALCEIEGKIQRHSDSKSYIS